MRVVLVVNRLINKVKNKQMVKDLNYWKNNCEEDYLHTPISVLRYITELEKKVEETINPTRCCTELKVKEEMNLVEYAISEGYTYNKKNHYFYKGGRMHLDSNVRDKYIKEVVMLIDITKHL